MKLIIDIEEKTYRRIQALVNSDFFEHDICGYSMQRIANGIPYCGLYNHEPIEQKGGKE